MIKPIFLWIALSVLGYNANAQTVGRKAPKISLQDYNAAKDDGNLQFEVDVRMADCISYIELKNEVTRKPVKIDVTENDYFLSDENGRDILLRLQMGRMKKYLKKQANQTTALTIFSKTGKPIYSNELTINKSDLILAAGNDRH
jgi:hypothetical protein